jgi:hypothetical protein
MILIDKIGDDSNLRERLIGMLRKRLRDFFVSEGKNRELLPSAKAPGFWGRACGRLEMPEC